MKKIFSTLTITLIGAFTYIILGGSCLPTTDFLANGYLFGQQIKTTVDSKLAKKIIEEPNNEIVSDFFRKYRDRTPNTKTLSEISTTYSTDVATLFFVKMQYAKQKNKFAQDHYYRACNRTTNGSIKDLQNYHVVFVPGLAYKEDATTGADFARQRKLFDSLNISNELIETEEWGLTDKNAQIIANRLKTLNDQHERILLVSASKGGLETSVALGSLLKPKEITSVKAWVSVGGILKGSPIADNYLKAPKCWFAEFMLLTKGKKIDLVKDLSYKQRSKTFQDLGFPDHVKMIHYVGIPWATKVSKEIKSRYCSMKEFGPNDGLTPISDELTREGIVISELGLNHYYRDANIDTKTLALAVVATNKYSWNK